jgi:hypothetical protein
MGGGQRGIAVKRAKVRAIVFLCIVCAAIAGTDALHRSQRLDYPWPIGPISSWLCTDNNFVLTVEERNITRHGVLTYTIYNGETVCYNVRGEFLQILHRDNWYEIGNGWRAILDWPTTVVYCFLPQTSTRWGFDWVMNISSLSNVYPRSRPELDYMVLEEGIYGELPNGTYRLVLRVTKCMGQSVRYWDSVQNRERTHYITTYAIHEFTITDEHERR